MRSTAACISACVVCVGVLMPAPAGGQSARATSDAASVSRPIDTAADWLPWTSGRYRITPGDVLEFRFPFVPELDQTATVQPDGFISLKEIPDVRVQGHTLVEIKQMVLDAYDGIVREPIFTVALSQFEKPYFIASGEVRSPGRYDLRGATTVTQALAFAGGTVAGANLSDVLLVRRHEDGVEIKAINVKHMLARRDLSEDPLLRPGDMLVVGKSAIGKLSPLLGVFRWRYW